MLDNIIIKLKQKGLSGHFLEEMTDHFATGYEQELANNKSSEEALQIILSQIEGQDLKPIQRKIFFIHHQNKIFLMTILFAILTFTFFTTPIHQHNTLAQTTPISIPTSDSLIFGKIVNGQMKISANFGRHFHPIKKERMMHKGLDILGKIGDSVFTPLSGIVEKVGEDELKGKYIEISHPDGFTTKYYHLSAILVKVNQTVERGIEIGKIGNTGMSTGPHLHFEILRNETPVDPEAYLRA